MKYDYRAKVNGVWYDAGTEIPESAKPVETVETPVEKASYTEKGEDTEKAETKAENKKPKKA